MSVVVDTNVVSFLFKKDSRSALYLPHLAGQLPVVSFATVAELDRWAVQRRWGPARRARMERFLARYLFRSCDRDLCRLWAEVCDEARRQGRPIDATDAWIAATALQLGIPLVTHNPGDFAGIGGLTIITEAGP